MRAIKNIIRQITLPLLAAPPSVISILSSNLPSFAYRSYPVNLRVNTAICFGLPTDLTTTTEWRIVWNSSRSFQRQNIL